MLEEVHPSNVQVLTDHTGWPVAVNEGAVWWMVAEVEPTQRPAVGTALHDPGDEYFQLSLANGQVLIASHRPSKRQWTIACRESGKG